MAQKKVFGVLILLFLHHLVYGQGETWNWYFGIHAGLSFSTGTPVPLLDGALNTSEGVATISDAGGQLLFYTDGQTVWNRNHSTMTNGTGLWGNASSTQSGVAIQKPGEPNIYFLFTVDDVATGAGDGMAYSIIDMTASGGAGAVTSKNNQLVPLANATEKITAVRHSNGTDIWVVTHGWQNNQFMAFLVTNTGVNPTPVVSSVGQNHSGTNRHRAGYLKASPNGEHIASTQYDYPTLAVVELLRFNPATGTVYQDIKSFNDNLMNAYGVEFSPDNTKLYISGTRTEGQITQYDLNQPDATSIINTRSTISSVGNFAAMQVASNGKMYIARNNLTAISVINEPNSLGNACNLTLDAVSLGGRTSTYGLPTFLQSYFAIQLATSNSPVCSGQQLNLYCNALGATSFQWNGPNGFSSTSQNPIVVNANINNSGTYTVIATSGSGASSTIQIDVIVYPLPMISLGNDITTCSNAPVYLTPGPGFASYNWNTGSTNAIIQPTTTGLYWVFVTDIHGCQSQLDEVQVVIHTSPDANPIIHN